MSVEGGGDRPQLSLGEKEYIDKEWQSTRQKLYRDIRLGWTVLNIAQVQAGVTVELPHHYEDDIREWKKDNPALADYIIEKSNPESVAAYDKLVDELHADWGRIVRENDNATLDAFKLKMWDIVNGGDRLPLSTRKKEEIERDLRTMARDLLNKWINFSVGHAKAGLNLELPQHYELVIRGFGGGIGKRLPAEQSDYIIEKSNPESVAAYDKLVDELHADWPRMVQKGDQKALEGYGDRVEQILNNMNKK